MRFGSVRRTSCARLSPLLAGCLLVLAGCHRTPPPTSPLEAPETPADVAIRDAIQRRLAAEPSLAGGSVRVEARGGMVLLRGIVQGIGAWRCALANAELVPGVETVVDYLVLQRGPPQVRCLAPAAARAAG